MTRSKRTSTVSTRPHGIAADVLQLSQPVETQLPSPVRTLPTVAQTPSSSSQRCLNNAAAAPLHGFSILIRCSRQSAAPVKVSALAIGGRGGGTRVDAAAEANTTVSGSSLAQPSAGAHNDDTCVFIFIADVCFFLNLSYSTEECVMFCPCAGTSNCCMSLPPLRKRM